MSTFDIKRGCLSLNIAHTVQTRSRLSRCCGALNPRCKYLNASRKKEKEKECADTHIVNTIFAGWEEIRRLCVSKPAFEGQLVGNGLVMELQTFIVF
jgi:hypothetical protein